MDKVGGNFFKHPKTRSNLAPSVAVLVGPVSAAAAISHFSAIFGLAISENQKNWKSLGFPVFWDLSTCANN